MVKLFIGTFYADVLREEQDSFTNGEILGQVVTIVVFYLKLLGVHYRRRCCLTCKAQAL